MPGVGDQPAGMDDDSFRRGGDAGDEQQEKGEEARRASIESRYDEAVSMRQAWMS